MTSNLQQPNKRNGESHFAKNNEFDKYQFVHEALPEINLENVETKTIFFDKTLDYPLLISTLSGWRNDPAVFGVHNKTLAKAAQDLRIGLEICENLDALSLDRIEHLKIREVAPDIPLLLNVPASQIYDNGNFQKIQHVIGLLDVNVLVLQLNALHEYLESSSSTIWQSMSTQIKGLCRNVSIPIIAKGEGFGISPKTAGLLIDAGVSGIEIGAQDKMFWQNIEKRVSTSAKFETAKILTRWGVSLADSLKEVRELTKGILIASGEIETGLDVAKAIALGADLVSVSGPLLTAAWDGTDSVIYQIRVISETLRVVMFATGSRNIPDLKRPDLLIEKYK
jgi:isopentenyl-diphosphate Delta-isomerase